MTQRQTVKVNAALAIIYKSGASVPQITARAQAYMGHGMSEAKGYEKVLNEFGKANPHIGNVYAQVANLIQASDDATVAAYGQALDTFVATGDEAQLDALAPTFEADMSELDRMEEAGEALPSPSDTPAPIRQTFPAPAPEAAPLLAPAPTTPSAPGSYRSVAGQAAPANGSYSFTAPKTGLALARQVGLPMAYTGPPIEA